ncbi:MAG TPA: DUF1178 domain-containing protein [Rhodospirillaceae bacterium]|nr:hypothetical protein [Candidatus Neomarinimicrobiota bacterium]HCX14703.1 DUF1178 domain-containing protein [Rhodospirillaceae bacterium]
MILYDLSCPKDHRFESWFRNSEAVEKLIKAGQVPCPVCGSKKVQKAPMAPRIAKSTSKGKLSEPSSKNKDLAVAMEKATEAFTELRQAIEKNFDHVGKEFPEEARRIHYGESESRGIYGDATPNEAQELIDEGIEVYSIPNARRTDS